MLGLCPVVTVVLFRVVLFFLLLVVMRFPTLVNPPAHGWLWIAWTIFGVILRTIVAVLVLSFMSALGAPPPPGVLFV